MKLIQHSTYNKPGSLWPNMDREIRDFLGIFCKMRGGKFVPDRKIEGTRARGRRRKTGTWIESVMIYRERLYQWIGYLWWKITAYGKAWSSSLATRHPRDGDSLIYYCHFFPLYVRTRRVFFFVLLLFWFLSNRPVFRPRRLWRWIGAIRTELNIIIIIIPVF